MGLVDNPETMFAYTEESLANDPAPVPQPSPTHGSYHWAFERHELRSIVISHPANATVAD